MKKSKMDIKEIKEKVERNEYEIRIITVYIPERPKWINERRRSKGGERDA